MSDIVTYQKGVCVPADMLPEDLLAELNASDTEGFEWHVCDGPFAGGQPNPCPCSDTKDRQHWRVEC
jgi:hypothetical protein